MKRKPEGSLHTKYIYHLSQSDHESDKTLKTFIEHYVCFTKIFNPNIFDNARRCFYKNKMYFSNSLI